MNKEELKEFEDQRKVANHLLSDKIELIMALMKKYKINTIEVEGIKIEKTIHEEAYSETKTNDIDEEALFWSAEG